ncbi:MAG: tetratricopeptide repeat protein [Terriglobia bacterium]|jgi:tetratricopeptide (TPR) repeat protein
MRKAAGPLLLLLLSPWQLHGSSAVRGILVFPFENQSPRSDLSWISESFAEVLSSRLAQPENYVLDRDERNAACTQLGMPIDTPLTLASEFKVAETLGVDWAILGNFNVTDNRLAARSQLLDVRLLKLSQSLEVSGGLTDLVDLQTRLAWRLLAMHDRSFTVGNEEDFRRRFPDIRLDAFENYIRGLVATDDTSRLHFFLESDRLDPSDHRAAFALGRLFFEQKDYANSAKWLRRLEESDPSYDESLFLRAVDEFFLGHEAIAEREFESLWKKLPLNEVSNNLGVLEARRGRYSEALANFERAYQSDPSDADFCFNRGVALWYEKRYQAAAESLREAVRANDDDSEVHTLLALVLEKLGDDAAEQRELDWLAEHEVGPAAEQPGDMLPQPRLKKNYNGRAFRLLELTLHNALEERLANASPQEHSDVHLALGKKFFTERRYAEAERELSEVVSLTPADPQGYLLLAQVLETEGKHQEAAAELEASLKLKNTVEAHLSLAHVYLSLNQPALARMQGQAALDLDPGNHEAEQLIQQTPAGAATSRKTP